ncbi:outer membrane lipoprotein carrier protein LolA [Achromobacter aloeverae]
MRRFLRYLGACGALLLGAAALPAQAFDLKDLQQQLQAAPVVRGQFVQQKFLRSLPQPLTSNGLFVLSAQHGLLWELRVPLFQDLLITPEGMYRRGDGGKWQALPQQIGSGRETRLFLAVLAGDTRGLQDNFDMQVSGSAGDWQLVMTPRSALLKQIFQDIRINGGKLVDRIELRETQGDRTVMEMKNARADNKLDDDETRDFAP